MEAHVAAWPAADHAHDGRRIASTVEEVEGNKGIGLSCRGDCADVRRRRARGDEHARREVNFFGTLIRHATVPTPIRAVPIAVVRTATLTCLVTRARRPLLPRPHRASTPVTAVRVAAVVLAADVEHPQAPSASHFALRILHRVVVGREVKTCP